MAKTANAQLDQDEQKILDELMKNSKQNIDRIAKKCGFSRQKAWRLIKQLEARQMIWGYSAVVDAEKQHLQKFILFIKRTEFHHDSQAREEIVGDLLAPIKKDLGITMVTSYRIHGEYDWVMIFTAKDILQAKKFAEAIMQKYAEKQSIHISQVLFTTRENYIVNPDLEKMKEFI
ncbi:MAG: Lrp/AsnC family transcriptional regulator [Candidatus Thermoplasmatota archaeon]|jgi:DNA-binding Lrp family transcriptional regulator|nr:Lrp/AsnC family transcriptional regulator [Candidatus Thermoplasmatota archaeon]